ncbi:hypothetical protein [Kineococcus sp. SYSU DK004]|uniref:hypothetical protein n=1 Tax=Kineococcus sp. SYSU DK004 TaxID=3383125 RepID=UPI003D7DAE78
MTTSAPPTRRPSVGTVLAVALLALAVAGAAWVAWEVTASGRAPRAFTERVPYPTCPPVEVPLGGASLPPVLQCLTAPGAGREGAEVRVTTLTEEGDPIRTSYRLLPAGAGVDVFTDATDDSYGSGGWEHVRCPDVAALRTGEGCGPA